MSAVQCASTRAVSIFLSVSLTLSRYSPTLTLTLSLSLPSVFPAIVTKLCARYFHNVYLNQL